MGTVWRATDTVLERVVALKQVRLEAFETRLVDDARTRILREARVAARLHHPAAVTLFDVVTHEGDPWLVLEYVPSRTLGEVLDERVLDVPMAARIGAQVAEALAAAHAVGIVHRDVKPANVLLAENGAVKLTDFGISRIVGDPAMTTTGTVLGTPAFLAPEVLGESGAVHASDVFGLGATVYAAVEGGSPYGVTDNLLALLGAIAAGRMVPPRRAGALAPVISQLLQADPGRRPTAARAAQLLWSAANDPAAARPAGSGPRPTAVLRASAPSGRPGMTAPSIPPALQVRPQPTRRRRLIIAIAVAAVSATAVAATVVAASGDRIASDPLVPGTCDTGRGTLMIGVLAPSSGPSAVAGAGMRNAVQLAVSDAERRCAVPGYRLVVVVRNESVSNDVSQISSFDSLVGVVGPLGTSWAGLDQLSQDGVVRISPWPLATAPRSPVTFEMAAGRAALGRVAADVIADRLPARVALVTVSSAEAADPAAGFRARAAERGLAVTEVPADPSADPAVVVESLRALGPGAVFYPGDLAEAGRLGGALATAGAPAVLGAVGSSAGQVPAGTRIGDFAVAIGGGDAGRASTFAADYSAAGFVDPPGPAGASAFDATTALIDAAARVTADEPWSVQRRAALAAAVAATKVDGVGGPIAFGPDGGPAGHAVTVSTVEFGKVEQRQVTTD
jgi:ABC-type branched-subunit amino acid transport system substrate-binding protein